MVAVVVTIVVGVVTAVAVSSARSADRATDNRDSLREQAGPILAQVFSVDRAHWEADRARARSAIAGEFAVRYAAELTRPPAAGIAAVRWTPLVVGITDVDDAEGAVVARAEVVTRPVTGTETRDEQTVDAGFTLRDGRWLLDRLDVIG
ncbi:hypothetical protein GS4_11_00450 [Gordonia soli NBRC 108243]|uniref:Mce-associated membrane protein n=1 Tax=Gordonia soli NBRC 108243 TaxID=1223545 RepID=M0QK10_9ACTN|nr:hypothetical protein GS4_11_00450 [Gordonia soli NBRC 108243]